MKMIFTFIFRKRIWMPALAFAAACSSDPDTTPANQPTPTSDAGPAPPASDSGGGNTPTDSGTPTDAGGSCSAAAETLLTPIDTVSTGVVTVLDDTSGVKTLFIDAAAGGSAAASKNPRIYVSFDTAARIDVTDKSATTSTAWDIAIKRPILFTNSGDGGPGQGGSVFVDKTFDAVTTADVAGKTFAQESFFDADCNPKLDATNAVKTSFDGWYDYDMATNGLSPHPGTWLVKGGTGRTYKVEILQYYANPDGDAGVAGGRYTLKVAALQ